MTFAVGYSMLRKQARQRVRRALQLVRDVCLYFCFPFNTTAHRGVYRDFTQALAAVPHGKTTGYNHEILARYYRAAQSPRAHYGSDYPVLFHLNRRLPASGTVLDIGGNIGIHYMHYRTCINLENVKWLVCEVSEIAKVGRQIFAGEPNITFVDDIAELGESRLDVIQACGSLQYIDGWALLLKQLIGRGVRPATILIDQVPVYDGPQFVTLQNGGLTYYPHYVFNREQFLATFAALGYQLADSWLLDSQMCLIPFHPDKSLAELSGFCFADASGLPQQGS